jgi:hypothetical protein
LINLTPKSKKVNNILSAKNNSSGGTKLDLNAKKPCNFSDYFCRQARGFSATPSFTKISEDNKVNNKKLTILELV